MIINENLLKTEIVIKSLVLFFCMKPLKLYSIMTCINLMLRTKTLVTETVMNNAFQMKKQVYYLNSIIFSII